MDASINRDGIGPSPAWYYGPTLDLIVGCGAWSIVLIGIVFILGSSHDAGIAIAFYALSIVCNYPHYMATLYRAYRTPAEFDKYRFFTLYVTLLLVLTAAFVHWSPRWAPLFFTIYTTWSPWHYTGQNFGIAMMFARRNGAAPTRTERNWLYAAFIASYLMIFLTLHTGVSNEPYVLSLDIPTRVSNAASLVCLAVFIAGALRALWPMVARAGPRATLAPLVVLSTQIIWFVVPNLLIGALGFELQRTSYSVGALAFMHCAQYLWITSYYARREAERDHVRWRPWVYSLSLVAGGAALFLPGPWIVSYAFHYDFTATFLIFGALVNIHHFVIDGVIWKLRDGSVASMLLGLRGEKPGDAAADRPWTEGWRPAFRILRAVAVIAVLAVAAVDLARFALAQDRDRTRSLERALRLNPFDVPVRTAIAIKQADASMPDEAIDTLKAAVAIDPYDVEANRALARLLLADDRFDDAYRHHKAMLDRVPEDTDTLVNFGTLAVRAGNYTEAIDAFQRALALDDTQPLAHLKLAEALAYSGSSAAAIPHYERYIALSASSNDVIGDVKHFATVLIETGDAYADVQKPAQAATYFARAAEFAHTAGDASLEGAAYGRLAALLELAGKADDAAEAYRQAIGCDRKAQDTTATAIEWFNYGQLLKKEAAPPRLVAACLLESRNGLASRPGPMLDTVNQTLADFEHEHPGMAAAVQRELPAALQDALSLAAPR